MLTNKKTKKNAGITLIALVITIIVLLILAGVSIATLTGENGILTQAQNAKTASDIAEVKEQAKLDIANWTAERLENSEDTKLNDEIVKTIIENANKDNTNKYYSELTETSIITKQENEILLSDLYTKTDDGGISASDIANNATIYYGKIVENYGVIYDDAEGATNAWRIFYADESNIYLIADDYIASSYAPNTKTNNYSIYTQRTDYILSFNNVIADYTGATDIDSTLGSRWLSSYWKNNSNSENENIKAVAYMLDTSIWNQLFKNDYAEYAIGGPTIEMFCESYKDTHPGTYVECEAESNSYGYRLKWSSDSSYSNCISGLTKDEYNSIYIKSDTAKDRGMWLAGPYGGEDRADFLWYTNFIELYYGSSEGDGYLDSTWYNYVSMEEFSDVRIGLRPIVCLKSNVKLEEKTDGKYAIK